MRLPILTTISFTRRFRLGLLLLLGGASIAGGCSTTTAPETSGSPTDAADAAAPDGASAPGEVDPSELACTAGVASGFAKTPAPFTLPAGRCSTRWGGLSGGGPVDYALLDVNADRRPDLVVTSDDCDAEVGTKRWDVYVASPDGSGFAKTPAPFTLPAGRCSTRWGGLSGGGPVDYALLDVNADRHPDLVVTSDDCDAEVGTKRWDVYAALPDGTGFAKTPAPFTLPAGRCSTRWGEFSGAGPVDYALLDVNADRHPDLVVTSDDCDAEVGTKRWDVYAALPDGTGFAKTPAPFTLPASRCSTRFGRIAGAGPVDYALLDVNADRHPDLVVTADDCDAEVGTKRWDVYGASPDGTGFAKTPAPFTLPAGRCSTRFDGLAGGGPVTYALLDVSCDGRGDLVVASDQCDAEVGTKRWDVYLASDTGFAKQPSTLGLPAGRCGDAFNRFGGRRAVGYSLLDVSADSRADLVVTEDGCDQDVGKRHWDAYMLE